MIKKEYRYFFGFLDRQQNYLNKMAKKGFRLVRTGKMSYEFESCKPEEFQYCLDFVAHKSLNEQKKYQDFLDSLGYRTFQKNINLNFSIGKVRWRPYGEGKGQISTNSGSFNKELLIIEKKNDGKPFELYTSAVDKMNYYKPLRNAYSCLLFFVCIMAALSTFGLIRVQSICGGLTIKTIAIIFMCIGLLLLIPVTAYQKQINKYRKESTIQE